jgi:type IV pilus assembly protein PilC
MKTRSGQTIEGLIIAENERSVAAHIREKGHYITEIKEKTTSFSETISLPFNRLSSMELAVFCRQFSTMIEAGIPMADALRVLIEQTENLRLKKVLKDIYMSVQRGEPLSAALDAHPGFFPEFMAKMTFAAEEGGTLDIVMNRLAVHFEKDYKLKRKIRTALAYPIAVTVFLLMVISFILIFAMPSFADTFKTMDIQLPLVTLILLKTSDFLIQYWPHIMAAVLLAGSLAAVFAKSPRGKRMKETTILRLPIFGKLYKKAAIAKLSRTLATLMRGGVPIIRSLEIVERIFPHSLVGEILAKARTNIISGRGLSPALGQNAFFPPMVIEMIAVGEKAGEVEKMLEKIADFYEEDVDGTLAGLSSVLEPALVGVLGIIIGIIIIAVMLPIFEMSVFVN